MTTNIELDNYMKTQKNTFAPFIGVYPSDKLPNTDKESFCLITNYDPSTKGGSHWVALAVRDNTAYWFDSYGYKPDEEDKLLSDNTDYVGYLQRYSNEILYNDKDLQSEDTFVCGLYASYFCIHGLPAMNKEAWKLFTTDTHKNDEIIQHLVFKLQH